MLSGPGSKNSFRLGVCLRDVRAGVNDSGETHSKGLSVDQVKSEDQSSSAYASLVQSRVYMLLINHRS